MPGEHQHPQFIREIREGDFRAAIRTIKETITFRRFAAGSVLKRPNARRFALWAKNTSL
jgi:hypothetical protein